MTTIDRTDPVRVGAMMNELARQRLSARDHEQRFLAALINDAPRGYGSALHWVTVHEARLSAFEVTDDGVLFEMTLASTFYTDAGDPLDAVTVFVPATDRVMLGWWEAFLHADDCIQRTQQSLLGTPEVS